MSNLWTDTIDRVGRGCKRHVYRATNATRQTKDGGVTMQRVCGTADDGPGTHATALRADLQREPALEYALDQNACLTCLDALDLLAYREQNTVRGAGAETVDYDPFGVFDETPESDSP